MWRNFAITSRIVHLPEVAPGIETCIAGKQPPLVVALRIQVHVNGFTTFCSSGLHIWHIFCRIRSSFLCEPFPIGAYFGPAKPDNVDDFLQPLIHEVKNLESTRLMILGSPAATRVVLSAVICDAPARAFVLRTKGHSVYGSCL